MATYEVKGADGSVYHIDGPDGADPSAVVQQVTAQHAQNPAATAPASAPPAVQSAPAMPGGNLVEPLFHVGSAMAASVPAAIASLYKLATAPAGEKAAQASHASQSVMDSMTYQPRSPAGQAVSGGIDSLLGLVPKVADKLTGGMADSPTLKGLLGPTGSEYLQAAANTGVQAIPALLGDKLIPRAPAFTAPTRLASAAGQGAKAVVEPFTAGGRENIAARALQGMTGTDPQALAAQIAQRSQGVLPNLQPTSAELASNGGISQLERTYRNNPEYNPAFSARNQQNRAVLTKAVSDIAGSPEDLAVAEKARTAAASPLYDMAAGQQITGDDRLAQLMARPSMQAAWQRAQKLASEKGEQLVSGQDIPESIADPALTVSAPGKGPAGPSAARDSMLEFLARHSRGLNSDAAEAEGVDKADMSLHAAHFGIQRAFRKNGLSMDQAAEMLHEAGYPVADEQGHYDPNVMLDRIQDELGGQKSYSLHNPSGGLEVSQPVTPATPKAPPPPPVYSGRAIQYLKMGLNDLKGEAESKGIGAHEQAALGNTSKALDSWLTKNVPVLKAADSAFKSMSGPVNQMQVGAALRDKLIPALGDLGNDTRLTANNFAQGLRNGDALTAQTTGLPLKLADVMGPEHLQTLQQVGQHLARRANADETGKAIGSNTAQNLISQNALRMIAGPLGLPRGAMEAFATSPLGLTAMRPLQFSAKLAEPRIHDLLARAALDPDYMRQLLLKDMEARRRGLHAPGAFARLPRASSLQGLLNLPQPMPQGLLAQQQ